MIKLKPKVFKTIVTVLENGKVNYALLENNKVRMFEEAPVSVRDFRNKFGDVSIVKSIYKDKIGKKSLHSQYVERKVKNLRLGILINYPKNSATASVKSMDGDKLAMKLTTCFDMESPFFNNVKDDIFAKFQDIFRQAKNYYVSAFQNGKITDVYVVRNADIKIPHTNSYFLKKEGNITELGKLWRNIKQL